MSANEHYTKSFGIEWTHYPDVQLDTASKYDWDISRSRLELVLGFPLEYLEGKTVIELGAGPGRFSEWFARYADELVVVDASDAVDVNAARHAPNVRTEKADFTTPAFIDKYKGCFDVVFCRGVIQHTEDRQAAIRSLFAYAKEGGVVVFDVYPRRKSDLLYFLTDFKYFWRGVLPRFVGAEAFAAHLDQHLMGWYTAYKISRKLRSSYVVTGLCKVLPFLNVFFVPDYLKDHPGIPSEQDKARLVASLLLDAIYAAYDRPMTMTHINETLASFGQAYYSSESSRCIVRCRKRASQAPCRFVETKNGVQLIDRDKVSAVN